MPTWLLAGFLSVQAADATSTAIALDRGAREVMLTQSTPLNTTLIAGSAAGQIWMLKKLEKKGHPKLAKWLMVSFTIAKAAVVAHNVRVIRGLPPR